MPEAIVIGGDLSVSRLGYGAMRLAGPGIWGDPADRDAARRVLRRAVELGVNFIDTADAYGPETNERLVADALHPYPPGLVIATKGGIVRPVAGPLGQRRSSRAPAGRVRGEPAPAARRAHRSLPAAHHRP